MPRRTHVCDKILEDEGILADVHLGTFPLDFIPFEMDVLSLELPTAFRVSLHQPPAMQWTMQA